jgi:hypothetical protein
MVGIDESRVMGRFAVEFVVGRMLEAAAQVPVRPLISKEP